MSDPVPLSYLPGVSKVNSSFADSQQGAIVSGRQAMGRFTDMDKIIFTAGFPEKMAGWEKAQSDQLIGVPRGMKDLRDFNQNIYTVIGTNRKLYYYDANSMTPFTDITPLREIMTGTLTNPIDTSSGSNQVTVHHTAHNQQVGDRVMLTASAAVGGLEIAGVYTINSVPDADTYTFLYGTTATSTVTGGGGTVTYEYYRTSLTNPFATVSGSSTVTVTHTSHGALQGDYVTFSGASAVGGLTINGEYEITTSSPNSYTINAGSAASSTATGGGTVSVQYQINTGLEDTAYSYGYGTGTYNGSEGYGTQSTSGLLFEARTWSLDNYGQQMLCNPIGGTIYVFDPTDPTRAYPLYGAPDAVLGMFVTSERYVTALGVNTYLTQMAWADQTDYTDWIASATNSANQDRKVQVGSYFVIGLSVRDGVNLLSTDTAVYTHLYTGDNNVYATNVSGRKCGFAGPLAACVVGGIAYWMGINDFWNWDGSATALPSDDIRDYVFKDINLQQRTKFVAAPIAARRLVRFFYCSADSVEINRYVDYFIDQQCWAIGSTNDNFVRTCWLDKELYAYPMACSYDGYLYNHEKGVDSDGAAMRAFIKLSPVDIANGKVAQDIFSFIPDFKRQTGDITLNIITQDWPRGSEVVSADYTVTDTTTIQDSVRESGRLAGYQLESYVLGGDFRLGVPLVEIQPAGARR